MRTYGYDAVRLSEEYSLPELNELRLSVENDPKSANPAYAAGNDINLYTKAARRKLDAIAWAVTYKLAELKAAREAEEAA